MEIFIKLIHKHCNYVLENTIKCTKQAYIHITHTHNCLELKCDLAMLQNIQVNILKLIVSPKYNNDNLENEILKLYLQQHVKPSTYPGRNITSICNISTLETTNIGELN